MQTQELEALYRTMLRIRRFDEGVIDLFKEGLVKGTAHSYVGQEAVAAGACATLGKDDFVVSHHRGHGHCIAKGASLAKMMAELMGRVTGYCKGLGGSMHIADLDLNILGANGIVGAGIGIGTGAALSNKMRGNGAVGIAFFGDGATNEGIFHECLNIGSLWKLPVVYLCENNQYGLSTSIKDSTSIDRVSKRSAAYSHCRPCAARRRRSACPTTTRASSPSVAATSRPPARARSATPPVRASRGSGRRSPSWAAACASAGTSSAPCTRGT